MSSLILKILFFIHHLCFAQEIERNPAAGKRGPSGEGQAKEAQEAHDETR